MRKFLAGLLFASSFALAGFAVSCGGGSEDSSIQSSSSSVEVAKRNVTFTEGEGYTVVSNAEDNKIGEGFSLNFQVKLGAFYQDSLPDVYVNEKLVLADADGYYSYSVGSEDISVRIDGVKKDRSTMEGSGKMDDAYVVTKPIDLLYIAEQVNAGNPDYTQGAYVLANDIDCQGEELEVIGNYLTQDAVFYGSFACETNSETGEFEQRTISNFTIRSYDSNNVGLFGAVFADASLESSAFFYGIRLDNFTIEMGVSDIVQDNKTVSCGGLIGFGVGASVILCDATNGTINVNAHNNYFSYVGGLIGHMQGFYNENYGLSFPSKITYTVADVDIRVQGGVALYAGGIVGYMLNNVPFGSSASVYNSYSTGDVNGALRSGGIVGGLGRYAAVANCYSTGNITAKSLQNANSALITTDAYCHAYAGGIVGYAENDSISHDNFFNGSTSATAASGKTYVHTNGIVGGGDEAGAVTADSKKYVAPTCHENVNLDKADEVKKQLGWNSIDWVFKNGELPTINYDIDSDSFTLSLTIEYIDPNATGDAQSLTVGGKETWSEKFFDTSISSMNAYSPIGSLIVSDNNEPILAQQYQASNGYLSYGFFFDKACTIPVPHAYIPMKEVTLYAGFADVSGIVGTYHIVTDYSTEPLTITIKNNGLVSYSDGENTHNALYAYDGKELVLENARLARYFDGEIVIDEDDEQDATLFLDPNFDLTRYAFYNFKGKIENGVLKLYDGIFFTDYDNALIAKKTLVRGEYYLETATETTYYTFYGDRALVEVVKANGEYTYAEYDGVSVNGNEVTLTAGENTLVVKMDTLSEYDDFKGVWIQPATNDAKYEFDGMGNWQYVYIAHERTNGGDIPHKLIQKNGSYTVENDVLRFTDEGVEYTASFNSDGFLELCAANEPAEIYYAENSYKGSWRGSFYELTLYGLNHDNFGKALFVDNDNYKTELYYAVAENTGNVVVVAFYYPNVNAAGNTTGLQDALFGYATFNKAHNTLSLVLPSDETESGYASDTLYLYDDFRGEWISDNEAFKNVELDFNGMGLYNGGSVTVTTLTTNKKTTTVYVVNGTADGVETTFSYDGNTYHARYDILTDQIHIDLSGGYMERKDSLAGVPFIDEEGTKYSFNGRSALGEGVLKITSKTGTSTYSYSVNGTGYDLFDGTTKVGSMVEVENCYLLTLGDLSNELYIENEFMGDWAINAEYALFHIGPTDTHGVMSGTFKGYTISIEQINPHQLRFSYKDNKMPITYNVFVQKDETKNEDILLLTESDALMSGNYIVCTRVSSLFGTWYWNRDYNESTHTGKTTLRFDGVSSGYANGYAERVLKLNYATVTTGYYYLVRERGMLMWSRDLLQGRTWYFALDLVDLTKEPDAVNDEEAFVLRDENGAPLQVLRVHEVDGLYLTDATDSKSGEQYYFDGVGGIRNAKTNEVKYSYKITAYNDDNSASLEVVDKATGKAYYATLDYSDRTTILFVLGEPIPETANA